MTMKETEVVGPTAPRVQEFLRHVPHASYAALFMGARWHAVERVALARVGLVAAREAGVRIVIEAIVERAALP